MTQENGITYIYALIDPRSNEVRYVGKANNPSKRFKNHLHSALDKQESWPVSRWIRKLDSVGLRPIQHIICFVPLARWEDSEKFWIAHFRAINPGRMLNAADGGGGSIGWKASPAQREANSIRRRLWWDQPSVRAAASEGVRTLTNRDTFKARMKQWHASEAGQAAIQRAAQLNAKTYIIQFPDGHEEEVCNLKAFCRQHNLDAANLHSTMHGKTYSHKGFRCKTPDSNYFQEEAFEQIRRKRDREKARELFLTGQYSVIQIASQIQRSVKTIYTWVQDIETTRPPGVKRRLTKREAQAMKMVVLDIIRSSDEVNISEIARRLDLDPTTVLKWAREGEWEGVQLKPKSRTSKQFDEVRPVALSMLKEGHTASEVMSALDVKRTTLHKWAKDSGVPVPRRSKKVFTPPCKHCGHEHTVKDGTSQGKQKFLCRGCNRNFQ